LLGETGGVRVAVVKASFAGDVGFNMVDDCFDEAADLADSALTQFALKTTKSEKRKKRR
jgi:6,7-dimethyl-8-ribityllumazine synthase